MVFFLTFKLVHLVVWVDTGKTLREQGIDESETVLLKRKFFFSDQNIDSRDPVQLNLLYVQARDAILDGTHPVTQEKGKWLSTTFVSFFQFYFLSFSIQMAKIIWVQFNSMLIGSNGFYLIFGNSMRICRYSSTNSIWRLQ